MTFNVRHLLVHAFFSGLVPAYVIERLYWEQRGMTIPLVVMAEIIFSVTVVASELPSGLLADRWGRKPMLVVAAAMRVAEFGLLLYATSFWHFAVVVMLAGIGRAAQSGAERAMLYDSLQHLGQAATFEKRLGQIRAVDFSAAMLAALGGSFLAGRYDLSINYWLSAGSALAAFAFVALLREPGPMTATDETPPTLREHVAVASGFFRRHPNISWFVAGGIVSGIGLSYIYEFWQLYAERLAVPVTFFGVISGGFMLLQLPGNLLAHALLRRWSARTLITVIIVLFTAGFGLIAFVPSVLGLGVMLLLCLGSGVIVPIVAGAVHHRADSTVRATIESIQSLALETLAIVAGLGFGWASARWDVFGGYGFVAVLTGVFLLALVGRGVVGRRENRISGK